LQFPCDASAGGGAKNISKNNGLLPPFGLRGTKSCCPSIVHPLGTGTGVSQRFGACWMVSEAVGSFGDDADGVAVLSGSGSPELHAMAAAASRAAKIKGVGEA
jgi:hypothetical protein